MSKMSNEVKKVREADKSKAVVNFMGGISYELDAVEMLKMVSASSIFGEPMYYRDGEFSGKTCLRDGYFNIDRVFAEHAIKGLDKYNGMKSSDLMEKLIDDALDCDYEAVLKWAETLRTEYLMRLNPQIIMVRAAIHPGRKDYSAKNPGGFHEANMRVMKRADDVVSQITYYLYKNEGKENIPAILKRSWAKKISSLSRYEVGKYKNKGMGIIDAVRICHANSPIIDELMATGTVHVDDNEKTWETLRAAKTPWAEILETINIPHMALLRNLRGILKEIDDVKTVNELLEKLKAGVEKGKQFPFRYMSAKKAVASAREELNGNAVIVEDALEDCMDIACKNLPHLAGNNAFLSDNSGSAWGTFSSEYGSVTVANIDNLSAVIGAANSDKGVVVKFGDNIKKFEISKRKGILNQAVEVDKGGTSNVGGSTEGGIWKFFREAMDDGIVYDNIAIFSDMQCGDGGLYGTAKDMAEYSKRGYAVKGGSHHIDVAKLIKDYRAKVNPKVNVYCIQTAGYNNAVAVNGYRTSVLYGWTGKELVYMDAMNKFWDEVDAKHSSNNQ